MNIDILKVFVFLVLFIISFTYWKKSKDKGWLWFTWIGTIAFLLKLVDILVKYYLSVLLQARK